MSFYYTNRYVETGACYTGKSSFKKCAMEPNDCDGIVDNNDVAARYEAHDQSSLDRCDPNNANIGRCLNENVCTARADDCPIDTSENNYRADDDDCTIQRDTAIDADEWDINNPQFTTFGSCYNNNNNMNNNHFCVYSPSDCDTPSGEIYLTPKETVDAGIYCDCSKVNSWACRNGPSGRVYCALKENGCTRDSYLPVSPYEQKMARLDGTDTLNCKLCIKRNTIKPTRYPTKMPVPTVQPTRNPTTNEPTKMPTILNITESSISNDDYSNGHIAMITSGAVVTIFLLMIFVYVYINMFRNIKKNNIAREKDGTIGESLPLEISFQNGDKEYVLPYKLENQQEQSVTDANATADYIEKKFGNNMDIDEVSQLDSIVSDFKDNDNISIVDLPPTTSHEGDNNNNNDDESDIKSKNNAHSV